MGDEQCADLSRDVERLRVLLDDPSMAPAGVAAPELQLRLGQLQHRLAGPREGAATPAVRWGGLSAVRAACREVAQTQLELLGGLAIREGADGGGQGLD